MLKNHLFIVIGEEHYNPLGVIRSLGKNGINPVYISIPYKAKVASSSKYVKKNHFVKDIHEAYDVLINEYGHSQKEKPFVITTDDDIEALLDENYDILKDKFIFFNAGKNGRVSEYMDKKTILDLAKKHGLKTLKTVVTDNGVVPQGLEYPVITKSISPNVGGWKSDVHICYSENELKTAFKNIKSPKVLIQKFIDKKNEYCLDGFSYDHGNKMFIPFASTYNYLIKGYYSPYMTAHEFDNHQMSEALNAMLREIGFEGIFSIEFLIDQDGEYNFSEINFRNSTWSYIGTSLGMPLPKLWAEAMLDNNCRGLDKKRIPDNYRAMVEPIDYGKRVIERNVPLADWLFDFKSAECTFYFDKDDIEPFMEMARHWDSLQ